jgi:hypothetical protein
MTAAREPAPTVTSSGDDAKPGGARLAFELRGLQTLAAWGVVALVNAVFVARLGHASFRVQALHHVYDFGLLLALGWGAYLLEAGIVWPYRAFRRSTLAYGLTALGVCALAALTYLVLGEDLAGFEARQAKAGSALPWRVLVALGGTFALVAVRVGAEWAARTPLRFVALASGVALLAIAETQLTTGYPGFHLLVAVLAALLVRSALLTRDLARSRRGVQAALAGAALWAVGSLLIRPPAAVWPELFRIQGAALVPFYALVLPEEPEPGPSRFVNAAWFSSRTDQPPVPPSPERPFDGAPPAVVLLTVDSLRADVLRNPEIVARLPNFRRLLAESVDFTEARSPTPSTYTTFHAVFTGKFFSGTRWSRRDWSKRPELDYFPHTDPSPRLSQLLDRADVRTVSVPSMRQLRKSFGVGKGFRRELKVPQRATAKQTISALLEELEREQSSPIFAALHLMDPHHPYEAGDPNAPPFERYVSEIENVDGQIGRLLDRLDKPDLASRSVLIVSADHGEAFGEHATIHHAVSVYDELLRVPLLLRIAGLPPRKIAERVTLMDLGPTVLDLFGEETPGHFLGQSLLPLARGQQSALTRPVAAESSRRGRAIVFPDGKKAIIDLQRRTRELYDLRSDPAELENLIDHPLADEYFSAVQIFFAAHALPNYEPPWRKF